MNEEARKAIVKARSQLLLHYPIFGSLSTYLKLKELPNGTFAKSGVPAHIGTNGEELAYEPKGILEESQKSLQATIAHETLHLGLGHLWRVEDRDKRKFNISTDYVINNMLDEEGLRPDNCLVNHEYDGMSAERVYNLLPDPPAPKCPKCSSKNLKGEKLTIDQNGRAKGKIKCEDCGHEWEQEGLVTEGPHGRSKSAIEWDEVEDYRPDSHSKWGEKSEEDKKEGVGQGKSKEQEMKEQLSKGMSEEEKEDLKQEWRRRLVESAESARMQGDLPAGMDRIIQDITEPKLDWRSLLRRAISSNARDDYTYNRPRKRYDIIYPTLRNPEIRVACAIDTSGSIGSDELDKFMSEIKGIVTSFESFKLLLMAGDTKIHNELIAHNPSDIEKFSEGLKGKGGTNYRPFFERTKEENDINTFILLGDSYGEMPENKTYNFSTIWVFSQSQHKEVPFGTVCILED